MDSPQAKIVMYAQRSLGDRINAAFDFIKENRKLLLKFTVYLLLPVSLVQSLSLHGLMRGLISVAGASGEGVASTETEWLLSFISYYGLYVLVVAIGSMLVLSLVYAMLKMYNERAEGLQGVTLGMLAPLLLRNMGRIFRLVLFSAILFIGVVICLALLASAVALPWWFWIVVMLGLIAVMVPLSLWAPVYLLENTTLVGSLSKGFRLGFATWGGTFMMLLIMGVIAGILQGITTLPWYIMLMVKMFFTLSDTAGSDMVSSAGYDFSLYLFSILQAFGMYLSMIISLMGVAYQYGHASEKEDHVTVESDIENFGK